MRGNPRISIRLEPSLITKLTDLAAVKGVSMSQFVREIILNYLERL